MARNRATVWGIVLMLVGIWALISALGYEWASLSRWWPVLVTLLGLVALYQGIKRRDDGSVWLGVAAILSGPVFAYMTLGMGAWSDMAWLWPAFPAIGGVAWLAAWLVDRGQVVNLVLGLVGLVVGAVGFLARAGQIGSDLVQRLLGLWPLILVVVGLGLVIQFWVQRRTHADRD